MRNAAILRRQLLSLLICEVLIGFSLPVSGHSHGTTQVSAVAKPYHATGRQREQLLQLRSIVSHALKADYPAIDDQSGIETKARNSTTRASKYWWLTKPFLLSSISAGCVSLAILVLLCIACSPVCSSIDCRCRKGFSTGEKNDYREEASSDGGSLCKEALLTDCPSPYGVIRYQMTYDQDAEQLTIVVKGCTDLPRNVSSSLNPYVVVRLVDRDRKTALGDKESMATPTEIGTTSPEFNFPCSFRLAKADLTKATVRFEVYDHEKDSKQHALVSRCRHTINDPRNGHEVEDLLSTSFPTEDEHIFRRRLKRGSSVGPGPGEICIRMHREAGEEVNLIVRVIECKGVHLKTSDGKPDKQHLPNTYVELMLVEPNGPIHTKRTETVDKSRNPYFNQEFCFPAMPINRLRDCALRISLVHVSDFLRSKQAVGSVELSADVDKGMEDRRFRLARDHWLSVTDATSQQPVNKCSWHFLMAPDEEMQLRRAHALAPKK